MRKDQEELWIQSIRAGVVRNKTIRIMPATIDQVCRAAYIYNRSYNKSIERGIMTDTGLELWMMKNNLLPKAFLTSQKNLQNSIDKAKKDLFISRNNKVAIKAIQSKLNEIRNKLSSLLQPKSKMVQNTCEFIAQTEKIVYLLKATTYKRGAPYRPVNMNKVIDVWQNSLASESMIRFLARSDTWRTIWANQGLGFDLFAKHKDADLTHNQRNLTTWSKMYDNIQESMECPSDSVIEYDDMLDGWFLIQKDNREKEKMKQEVNELAGTKNSQASHLLVADRGGDIDFDLLNDGYQPHLEQSLRSRN
jgi:hypothetical protein